MKYDLNHQVHLVMGTMKHHTGVDTDTIVTAFKRLESAQAFVHNINRTKTAPVRYWVLSKVLCE